MAYGIDEKENNSGRARDRLRRAPRREIVLRRNVQQNSNEYPFFVSADDNKPYCFDFKHIVSARNYEFFWILINDGKMKIVLLLFGIHEFNDYSN